MKMSKRLLSTAVIAIMVISFFAPWFGLAAAIIAGVIIVWGRRRVQS